MRGLASCVCLAHSRSGWAAQEGVSTAYGGRGMLSPEDGQRVAGPWQRERDSRVRMEDTKGGTA